MLGYLKAIGAIEEYENGGLGCDVVCLSLDEIANEAPGRVPVNGNSNTGSGLDVRAMAHMARRCIWERLRSRTPYRICLLIAGMMPVGNAASPFDETDSHTTDAEEKTAFLSQRVQNQVREARRNGDDNIDEVAGDPPSETTKTATSCYQPRLYWLDEYGSLQKLRYGAHGHGSNFILSILDQNYKRDLSRAEAIELMNECFRELRSRYVINSPEAPCIKCVDTRGVRWVRSSRAATAATTKPVTER